MRKFFRKRDLKDGTICANKEEEGGSGKLTDEDEPELPSVSTFLPVNTESPTISGIELEEDDDNIIRHSTPRSVSRYNEFPFETTRLNRILSPIPEQESRESLCNLPLINNDENVVGANHKEKKKSLIPIAVKRKKTDAKQIKSTISEKEKFEKVGNGHPKSKNERLNPARFTNFDQTGVKRSEARHTKSDKYGVVEKSELIESKKHSNRSKVTDRVLNNPKSDLKREHYDVRTTKRDETNNVRADVTKKERNQPHGRIKSAVKTQNITRSDVKKEKGKVTKNEAKVKRKSEEEKIGSKKGHGTGKATTKVGLATKSAGINKQEQRIDDDSGKKTEELHEEFARLCAEVKANKEKIWENDDILFNQDNELESLMTDLQVLAEMKEGLTKKVREMKEEHGTLKEKATEVRVAVRTNILDAQMYDNESDKIQEDIWAIRNEIIQLEFMPSATEELRYELRKIQEENEKLEKDLKRLESGDYTGMIDYDLFSNKSTDIQTMKDDDDGQRIVVLPKIHRRGNADNKRSFFRKIGPRSKLKYPDPLPSIKRPNETEEIKSLNELAERNELPKLKVLPSIDSCTTANTICDEYNVTKLNPKDPLPSIGLGSDSKQRDLETNISDCTTSCFQTDCITPRPPTEKKPEGKFTRRNIIQKLKSIFAK